MQKLSVDVLLKRRKEGRLLRRERYYPPRGQKESEAGVKNRVQTEAICY